MSTPRFVILFLFFVTISPMVSASPGYHHNNGRHKKDNHHHKNYARVIFVKPIYKTVRVSRPQLQCTNHISHPSEVTVVRHHSPERVVLGGLLGGIVGHELGNDRNRAFTTMAGVVIGTTVANNMAGINYTVSTYIPDNHRHCRQQTRIIEKQKLVGYKVKYRYRGKIYITRTHRHPGERLAIHSKAGKHRYDM